jgi:hypothetical protein
MHFKPKQHETNAIPRPFQNPIPVLYLKTINHETATFPCITTAFCRLAAHLHASCVSKQEPVWVLEKGTCLS